MADITIGSNEIQLIKQQIQRHYVKLILLNQQWNPIGTIQGRITSGNISIDANDKIRRTASLNIKVDEMSMFVISSITINTYIQIQCGIKNNYNNHESWYNFGYFIVNNSNYKFDPTTRNLDINLSDLMLDLTGDRAGALHAYTSLVKNQQRIDDVMQNVLMIAGFKKTNITSIGAQRDISSYYDKDSDNDDYKIPYSIDFPSGVTAYDIIEKLVSLYPNYQAYFDTNGTFVCEKVITEQDSSYVLLDAPTLRGLVISEDTSIDWTQVKNIVEVWGKDGLYYGEAKDENANSPFNINAIQPLRYVVTSSEEGIDVNNICDRYVSTEKANDIAVRKKKYETEIAELSAIENPTREQKDDLARVKGNLMSVQSEEASNVSLKGNELAEQWAKHILFKKARLNETITLQVPFMPFLTDVNFKISYASKIDNQIKTWFITSVSHDISNGTTTMNGFHFYEDTSYNYWDELPIPVVVSHTETGMTITVIIEPVQNATYYELVIDHKPVARSTGTTLIYQLADIYAGEHTFYVRACADGWRDSKSVNYTFTVQPMPDAVVLGTNVSDFIKTNVNDMIIINEGV